jgi:hypothetical protein
MMLNWALASWSSVWIGATIGVLQHGILPYLHVAVSWSV